MDPPSITKINSFSNSEKFQFQHILPWDTYQTIMELNKQKSTSGKIPTKVLQILAREISVPLTDCINASVQEGKFLDELKLADIVPIFKKDDPSDKANYRLISLLP